MSNDAVMPRGAVAAAAIAAVACFAMLLAAATAIDWDSPAMSLLPVGFVALLWLIPLAAAVLRGERWTFVAMLALLVFLGEATFRARSWTDKSIDWQVALKGCVWLGAGTMGLINLGSVMRALRRPAALAATTLVALLVLSALWSPVPSYTLVSGLGFVCALLFALAATQRLDETEVLLGLAVGYAMLVIPSLMVAPFGTTFAGPSPGSTATIDRLAGITDHPIGLGEASATAIFLSGMLLARRAGRGWIWWTVIGAALVTLFLSRSRMPAIAMLVAWGLAYSHYRGVLAQALLATVVAAMVAGMAILAVGFEDAVPRDLLRMVSRSGESREILTLTGRIDIWTLVVHKIAEAPWLGHGFASGNTVLHDFKRWSLNHAHNAYLQALLYLGVAGLALLLAATGAQLGAFVRAPMPARDTLAFYALFIGLTEEGPLPNVPGPLTLLWLLAIGFAAAPEAAESLSHWTPPSASPSPARR